MSTIEAREAELRLEKNREIARQMREGVNTMWPDASYHVTGLWQQLTVSGKRQTCLAQMLFDSFGGRTEGFFTAANATLHVLGAGRLGVDPMWALAGINDDGVHSFDQLKGAVLAAADNLEKQLVLA